MKKVYVLVVCVLLLFSALPLSATADAVIIPHDDYNTTLEDSIHINDECRAMNVFLSNYVECAVETFSSDNGINTNATDNKDVLAYTLKNLELNPMQGMSSFVGNDGITYMNIPTDILRTRAQTLFNRSVDIDDLDSDQDGVIVARADHYNAAINVYASTYILEPKEADHAWMSEFEIYQTSGSAHNRYAVNHDGIKQSGDVCIGKGFAHFIYNGDRYATSFSPTDFSLQFFRITDPEDVMHRIPYQGENTIQTTATVANSVAIATDSDTTPSETPPPEETTPSEVTETSTAPESDDSSDGPSKEFLLVLIAACVVLMAVVAAVAVILLIRQKQ